jgi:hypothetical protein
VKVLAPVFCSQLLLLLFLLLLLLLLLQLLLLMMVPFSLLLLQQLAASAAASPAKIAEQTSCTNCSDSHQLLLAHAACQGCRHQRPLQQQEELSHCCQQPQQQLHLAASAATDAANGEAHQIRNMPDA